MTESHHHMMQFAFQLPQWIDRDPIFYPSDHGAMTTVNRFLDVNKNVAVINLLFFAPNYISLHLWFDIREDSSNTLPVTTTQDAFIAGY